MSILTKIFGDADRQLKKYMPIVEAIEKKEAEFEKLSDNQLKDLTVRFKAEITKDLAGVDFFEVEAKDRKKIVNQILEPYIVKAFAAVREVSKRTIGLRHFREQLLGGLVLHDGVIAEMKTGEGKTLVATLPLYLNALTGLGSHLVTVNDYLSKRDATWMGPIFYALGVTVAAIGHEQSFIYDPSVKPEHKAETMVISIVDEPLRLVSRQEAYNADITYGTNNEFGFDYLRDNMVYDLSQMAQSQLNYAIVDEVDSILIDEARTPLIISAPAEESADLYNKFARLIPQLKENEDYNIDEKMRASTLTDAGISKLEQMLGLKNIYEAGGMELVHHIEQALRAHALYKLDRDYVVKDGEVVIVDEFTGRLMPGRRYSEGLHQAIEAKEKVEINRESETMATISFQNYFRLYTKLAGMTGTAATEAEEFFKIYALDVISIPTHNPMIRKDLPDLIYKTETSKIRAIVAEAKRLQEKGQPVLIGTISIDKNEILSDLLTRNGVKHEVLNAKNHEREATIIAQAGRKGSVTVATNMAGRGVDIILGGNPYNEHEAMHVKQLGGLHVMGTERHEARRIDNQLRGRSGRQGDSGSTQFFVSLEDDLMRIFGGDRIKGVMTRLGLPEDQPIEHGLISKSIESAQKKVEGHNFDIRKHLVEYDDVMNKQREVIYKKRRDILSGESLRQEVLDLIIEDITHIVDMHTQVPSENDQKEIIESIKAVIPVPYSPADLNESIALLYSDYRGLLSYCIETIEKAYAKKESEQAETIRQLEKILYLRVIDTLWIHHLTEIDYLRQGIGLRGYGQRDPLVEYKFEAHQLFNRLLTRIEDEVVNSIFKVSIAPTIEQKRKIEEIKENSSIFENNNDPGESKPIVSTKKIGRNDPCDCGSGKKYKHCCGKVT